MIYNKSKLVDYFAKQVAVTVRDDDGNSVLETGLNRPMLKRWGVKQRSVLC